MSVTIIPFEPIKAHYQAAADLHNLTFPDYKDLPEDWERGDKLREKKYFHHRVLLADAESENILGIGTCGHTHWAHHDDRYYVDVMIDPAEHGKGYGKRLYQYLLETLEPRNPLSIEAETREGHPRGVRFLEDRGYVVKTTEYTSKLDLGTFDPAPYAGLEEKVLGQGIRVESVKTLQQSDPNFLRKYYDVLIEIDKDVPWHEETTVTPFDIWVERFKTSPHRIDEAFLVAVDGDDYVALTMLSHTPANPDVLYTGLTGVKRGYRRKGLATYLKVKVFEWAKDQFVTPSGNPPSIIAENEENNPMYKINEMFGFVKQPSFLFYRKELRGE